MARNDLVWEKEEWQEHSKCKGLDPAIFFDIEYMTLVERAEIKKMCQECPVDLECKAYGKKHIGSDSAVYGGVYLRGRTKEVDIMKVRYKNINKEMV